MHKDAAPAVGFPRQIELTELLIDQRAPGVGGFLGVIGVSRTPDDAVDNGEGRLAEVDGGVDGVLCRHHGGVRRRRECDNCHQRFSTYERPILAIPLIIKADGTREEFDREKLMRGVRIACAKRPVPAADIERLIGHIEAELEKASKSEVPSRVIGDMVINGLKEMDQIAYIRYAIVYLRLDDLGALRREIDNLLKAKA